MGNNGRRIWMPYKMITQLPAGVKNNLPKHAQEIYKEAFNSAEEQYGEEGRAHNRERGAAGARDGSPGAAVGLVPAPPPGRPRPAGRERRRRRKRRSGRCRRWRRGGGP